MILPKVSICVPTYNGREHLKECLDSIRAQSFKDFEVVICDDQSSDGTLDFARELAQGDERFRLIENPRRFGLVGNWNNCIKLSRGEWIKFVFQDDLLLPNCLERMVTVAGRENSRFLACRRGFRFEANTSPETRAFYADNAAGIDRFFSKSKTCQPDDFAQVILEGINANFVGEPTVTLIHRELFDRCGLFNENLIMCCDSEYWYRAGTHAPVTFIPETLATFRVHGTSTSTGNFGRRRFRMDLLDPLIVVHEFINHPGYDLLRQVARKHFGANYLDYVIRERAWRAWSALKEKQALTSEDATFCQQEWESVCKTYPQLQDLARPPKIREKLWEMRRNYSPKKVAGNALRAVGLCN